MSGRDNTWRMGMRHGGYANPRVAIVHNESMVAEGFDPFAPHVSRSAIRRFGDRLRSCVESYTRDVVGPALEAAANGLPASGRPAVRIDEGGERVRFAYPSAVENLIGYLASEVLLEFGGRNVVDLNERHEIVPEIAAMTDGLDYRWR